MIFVDTSAWFGAAASIFAIGDIARNSICFRLAGGFICREGLLAMFAFSLATFCLSGHPCGAKVSALSSSSPVKSVLNSSHVLFAKANSPACTGELPGYCVTAGCAGPGQRRDQRQGD